MFNLLMRSPRPEPVRRARRASPRDDGGEVFMGCGWFDSSHDLRLGLLAAELASDDPLPDALALEICLAA